MFLFKNYYNNVLKIYFFRKFSNIKIKINVQKFSQVETQDMRNTIKDLNLFNLNSRILFYLFFSMIIEKKYIQLFYFSNFFFQHSIVICSNIELINYLVLKLQNEIELSLFIIKHGFLNNSSRLINSKKKFFHKNNNFTDINYLHLILNNSSDNLLKLVNNNAEIYKSLEIFKKDEMNCYINCYLKFLFYQDVKSLNFNSNYTGFSSVFKNKRYETLNYNLIKGLFSKFFNILINCTFFNTIPFFIFPKYLEEEIYIFYSYLLFVRKAIIYNIKYTRWLVTLKNLGNFNLVFGTPCFFFILDVVNSFISINSVKNFKLPVGALVTQNTNANFFDYPIFISSQNKSCVYLYFLLIVRVVFYGLHKRKKFFWGFFIKYKIIYELKKKLIDI